ncbi:hypothetical protein Tco_1051443 [Tanacetum coccineum]
MGKGRGSGSSSLKQTTLDASTMARHSERSVNLSSISFCLILGCNGASFTKVLVGSVGITSSTMDRVNDNIFLRYHGELVNLYSIEGKGAQRLF